MHVACALRSFVTRVETCLPPDFRAASPSTPETRRKHAPAAKPAARQPPVETKVATKTAPKVATKTATKVATKAEAKAEAEAVPGESVL